MAVTLNDIAKVVGVKKATVSRVLNNKPNPVKVSETTKRKIFEAAKSLGYHPNAAARALSTQRTGHIGFLLSDTITGGWANMYYATIFAGVEQGCRTRGYGLNTSLYNLSSVDSFVFPPKVGQRSVDGLVMTGYAEAAIAARFREFGIPCVCIGDDTELAEIIPTVACDIVGGTFEAVKYGASLGHRHVLYCAVPTRRGREVGALLAERVISDPSTAHVRLSLVEPSEQVDYQAAGPIARKWMQTPATDRPTLIIASDQTLTAFIGEITRHGLECPKDISLISSCDTHLCTYSYPCLTSIDQDLKTLGQISVELLINHLDEGRPLTPEFSRNHNPCRLVVRESCARISLSGDADGRSAAG